MYPIEVSRYGCMVPGFDGDIVFDSNKPDGTMRKLMDSSRLNLLGWRVSTTLRDGLSEVYKGYQNN